MDVDWLVAAFGKHSVAAKLVPSAPGKFKVRIESAAAVAPATGET